MLPLPVELACPPADGVAGVHVELASSAHIVTPAGRVIPGAEGSMTLDVRVGLVHHGGQLIAIDAGMGRDAVEGRYPRGPLVGGTDLRDVRPLVELAPGPLDLVVLTHSHYDHVGGLVDLEGVPVWVDRLDLGHLLSQGIGIPRWRWRRGVDWHPVDLRSDRNERVLGRPAIDVLGDGSVWMISTPGHTPGHAAVLVRAEDGPWLFTGDTVWVNAHLGDVHRPAWVRALLDAERPALEESLAWVRWLARSCEGLRVVTGHDMQAPVLGATPVARGEGPGVAEGD